MKTVQQSGTAKGWIHYRNWILIEGVEIAKGPYVNWFKRKKKSWGYSNDELLNFPENSLGHAMGRFLIANDICLIDKLEDHDAMHVLFQLETNVEDEAIMQYLLIGNGKRTLFCLGTAVLSWILLPMSRKKMKTAYHAGKKMRRFYQWNFQFLLREPLSVIRAMIHKDFGELEAPILW